MSRPRYYWYHIVKTMIQTSTEVTEHSLQTTIIAHAMEDANKETLKLPNGDLRIKAVREILIDKSKTLSGVCREVNYQERTVQSWVNSYVNLVGKKAGY